MALWILFPMKEVKFRKLPPPSVLSWIRPCVLLKESIAFNNVPRLKLQVIAEHPACTRWSDYRLYFRNRKKEIQRCRIFY